MGGAALKRQPGPLLRLPYWKGVQLPLAHLLVPKLPLRNQLQEVTQWRRVLR